MNIDYNINKNILEVKVLSESNLDAMYAYYLVKDEVAIEKIWYSTDTLHSFLLQEPGVYYVTVFQKHEDIITTEKTEPVFYFREGYGSCPFLRIEEMEMTNQCNLSCRNCGTPVSKYPKGFIDDRTVLATLAWTRKGQTLNYHRVGEPLLHPELSKYIRWGVEAGIKPVISTNGLLLTEEKLFQLYSAGLRHLVITLHTMRSLEAFLMCYDYFSKNNIVVRNFSERHHASDNENIMYFQGKVLEFPDSEPQGREVRHSLDKIPEECREYLQKTPVHTWAGNVPGTRQDYSDDTVTERQEHCYFIRRKVINVRWDGSVVGCCFDMENDNALGNIREYPYLRIDKRNYKLCKHCDANWAVKQE